ncbi:tyrosine-type recombinase/integrase [Candidatus Pacearchaeota archaeon]|nr:tyrosine-type recombinase/integrase [Candidatus Pacearchaeota archaeon]
MRGKFFEFNKELNSDILYDKLSSEEKKILDNFKNYLLISASEDRTKEAIREALRFKEVVGKDFDKIDLEDLRYFLKQLNHFHFADYTKNKVKGFVYQFLKWNFKDWSERFNEFEDIKYNTDAQRKQEITEKDILTKEDIEKIMIAEKNLFYQTFFIVQYEGGLRTGECRRLKWGDIEFDEDEEYSYIVVSSKKNKNRADKKREIPLKLSTKYLKKLKEQQKNEKIITKWVFPSPQDPSEPISKYVNRWFKDLTLNVLGKAKYNYLLRHSRGTELQRLVKDNIMSKDNAVQFLGHSEKMFDKVYSHMSRQEIKKVMKKQIYDFKEITPEQKEHYQKEIDDLKKEILEERLARERIQEAINEMVKSKKEHEKSVVEFIDMVKDDSSEEDIQEAVKIVKANHLKRVNNLKARQ